MDHLSSKNAHIIILQVIPRLNAGGVERGVLEIARAIKQAGHTSIVCSAGGKMVGELESLGSNHIVLPVASKNPLTMLINVWRLIKVIKRYNVDIVHVRSRAPAWSCLLACKLCGTKLVTTFHGTYGAKFWFKRLYNSVMLRGDVVIAISDFIFDHMRTVYRHDMSNVMVINRGVDVQVFRPEAVVDARTQAALLHLHDGEGKAQEDGPILLLPARFTRWKGHLYLLEILATLSRKNYKCYLVGESTAQHDNYMMELQQAIKDYNLQANVYIRPHYRDMAALYKVVDIVLSMSQQPEAFGRTIVEAQCMKKIIIATEHGGAIHTITHGKTGYFIPVHNLQAAAKVLELVLAQSPAQRAVMGEKAASFVQSHYTAEQMCDKTLKVYKSLI